MQQHFDYLFEDEGPTTLSYDTSLEGVERAEVVIEDGKPVLYVNAEAAEVMARVFAKLAKGSYTEGFHIHLPKDLDEDQAETIRINLIGQV